MSETTMGGLVNPAQSTFITILGKKGSGKSYLARRFWDSYPYDELVVDVHAEIDDPEARKLTGEVPARWPMPEERGERSKLRYIPDPGSSTYRDEIDRCVALALAHRKCMLWLDEVGDLTNANVTPPHMRRALHQGRHRDLSMLMCGPRAVDINPLVLSQADLVYVFDLPHPHDRERVAAVNGYPPKAFDAAVQALGEHEYLRWDGKELAHLPALPAKHQDREAALAKDV